MGDVFTVSTLFSNTSKVSHAKVVGREAVPPFSVAHRDYKWNERPLPKNIHDTSAVAPSSPSYTLTGSTSDDIPQKGTGVAISFKLLIYNVNSIRQTYRRRCFVAAFGSPEGLDQCPPRPRNTCSACGVTGTSGRKSGEAA